MTETLVTKTPALEEIAAHYERQARQLKRRIIICGGTGCIANGAMKVREAICAEMAKTGDQALIDWDTSCDTTDKTYFSKSGCQGFCQMGPIVRIEPEGIFYCKVKPEDAAEIVLLTLKTGEIIDRLVYVDPVSKKACRHEDEIAFYTRQSRIVMANSMIEPDSVEEYVSKDGYLAARQVIMEMTPEQVCQTVIDSGLRGRGGGGFPTGRKWALTLASKADKKYVICNGDEGDPGAFMDRSVLEGNPHSVIEGMMIAAKAIGADEGIVYVRAEYPLAVQRMRLAIKVAEEQQLLGKNLFGTDFAFKMRIMEGAGAFVCGEETALIASLEGKRGMPSPKPPFPAQSGLYGKPTLINNVETFATIPYILRVGAEEFRRQGTEKSPGTKTFALTGHVANTGLIEVPFGTTLREIVYEIGGGVTDNEGKVSGEDFKSVQIGGPSGGCLTPELLDLPLDFDSLRSAGAMVGSGGLVVMNKQTCMVKIARFFMKFTQNESCGKCVPCREGTKQMLALLDEIIEGRADMATLDLLEQTAKAVQLGSLCGLGKTAPNPVLSTMRYFRQEYEAHVLQKYCPAGECKALSRPEIVPELCRGCTACMRKCPVDAIIGKPKQVHWIDPEKCIKCGACKEACRFEAVVGI